MLNIGLLKWKEYGAISNSHPMKADDHPQSGRLGFSTMGRKDKKHVRALIVAVVTGA